MSGQIGTLPSRVRGGTIPLDGSGIVISTSSLRTLRRETGLARALSAIAKRLQSCQTRGRVRITDCIDSGGRRTRLRTRGVLRTVGRGGTRTRGSTATTFSVGRGLKQRLIRMHHVGDRCRGLCSTRGKLGRTCGRIATRGSHLGTRGNSLEKRVTRLGTRVKGEIRRTMRPLGARVRTLGSHLHKTCRILASVMGTINVVGCSSGGKFEMSGLSGGRSHLVSDITSLNIDETRGRNFSSLTRSVRGRVKIDPRLGGLVKPASHNVRQ